MKQDLQFPKPKCPTTIATARAAPWGAIQARKDSGKLALLLLLLLLLLLPLLIF